MICLRQTELSAQDPGQIRLPVRILHGLPERIAALYLSFGSVRQTSAARCIILLQIGLQAFFIRRFLFQNRVCQ